MIFYKFFYKFLRRPGGGAPRNPPHGDPPYKPSLGGPCFPTPEKIPVCANGNDSKSLTALYQNCAAEFV